MKPPRFAGTCHGYRRAMKRRTDPDVEQLWQDFHSVVNMNGHELRTWLLTEASGPRALPGDPDPGLPAPGRDVVDVLNKRKVDLTDSDLEVMSQVIEDVQRLRASRPAEGAADSGWRRQLMSLGHDPLREPPE